jgi:hypothetical protein
MRTQLLCILLASVLFTLSMTAQDKMDASTQQWKTQVGVGIGYEPFRLFSTGSTTFITSAGTPVSLYLPIRTSPALTVEPEFGLFTYSSETTSSGVTTNSSASVVRLGAGILATVASGSSTRIYVGPRIGIYLVKEKTSSSYYATSSTEMSETDFSVGGSLGAEYFFVETMSLGGEALVTYYSFGEPTYTPSSSMSSGSSRSMFSSNVIFFLRWYF